MRALALIAAAALTGCATTLSAPPTVGAQQSVYVATTAFEAGLRVAVAYENLPACGPATGSVCSDPDVVTRVTAAAQLARASLSTAEDAARSSTDAGAIAAAVAHAQSDIDAFTALVAPLPRK